MPRGGVNGPYWNRKPHRNPENPGTLDARRARRLRAYKPRLGSARGDRARAAEASTKAPGATSCRQVRRRARPAPLRARPRPSSIEPLPRDLAGECLRRLPPTQRRIVAELLAGWSLTETAARFGMAVATASQHLRRARAGRLPRARGRGGSIAGTRGGGPRHPPRLAPTRLSPARGHPIRCSRQEHSAP